MGHPRKSRRIYRKPRKMFDSSRIEEEGELVRRYGLKNKKEAWRAKATVARLRAIARELLAKANKNMEAQLLDKLYRRGLLPKNATLEDALKVTAENLLERRLQTRVFREGLATSIQQARQLITHGHIAVNGQRLSTPKYPVSINDKVSFYSGSKVASETHPMRIARTKTKRKEERKPEENKSKGAPSQQGEKPVVIEKGLTKEDTVLPSVGNRRPRKGKPKVP